MLILDKEQVKSILINEFGYTSIGADSYLRRYPPIHDELVPTIQQWLKDRSVQDVNTHGLSIREIMRIQNFHFLEAVKYLNVLLDEDLSSDDRDELIDFYRTPIPVM